MSAPIRLSIRRGDQEVASAVATDRPQKIGRSKQCDVMLDDAAVSRVHALLAIEGGETVLIDQNSQNGLWVQGQRLARIVLDPSVVVAMGPFRIVCEATGAERREDTVRRPALPVAAPPPPAAASGQTTEKTKAVSSVTASPAPAPVTGSPAPAPITVSPAPPPASVPPPAAAKPREATGKTAAAPPVKPDAPKADAPKFPPPPISKPLAASPPAAVRAKPGSGQNAALLVGGVVVMLAIGGAAMALWLRSRNVETRTPPQDVAKLDMQVTTTTPPPAVSSTSVARDAAVTTSATTVPIGAEGSNPPRPVATTTISAPVAPPERSTADTASKVAPSTTTAARRPAEAPAGVILATPKPRETRAALVRRSTELTSRLNQGKAALDRGDIASAISILNALQNDEPNFGDVSAQLARARDAQKANAQARAQAAFDDAQQKERQQDFVGAIQTYQQAERIDADLAAKVASAIAGARTKQKAAIDGLFKQANADFAFRRPTAIPLFQRILKLMSDDDPRRNEAQTKLNQLQGGKQ